MKLMFDITSWQAIKDNHQLAVSADSGIVGWSIRLIVAEDEKILLQLYIKSKQDLITFWKLMHIAGVMMSKGKKIQEIDRSYFISGLKEIGVQLSPDSEVENNAKADQYAVQMQKFGKDLWELLGKSNLMLLLS